MKNLTQSIFALAGAYLTWHFYNTVNEWQFLTAFVGGALTLILTSIVGEEHCNE